MIYFAKKKKIDCQNAERCCQFQPLHYHNCLFFIILIRKLFNYVMYTNTTEKKKQANQMFNTKINNMTQQNLYTTSKWDSLGLLDSKYTYINIDVCMKRNPTKNPCSSSHDFQTFHKNAYDIVCSLSLSLSLSLSSTG